MNYPKKLYPVVDITTRPIRNKKRQVVSPSLSPEVQTEPPSPNLSPKKLYPVVEITTRPIRSRKRQVVSPSLSPEVQTEPPSPNLPPKKLYPVVEITTRPIRSRKRQVVSPSLSPEVQTEPASPNLSPKKKRKHIVDENDTPADSSSETELAFPQSPTVSDFAAHVSSPSTPNIPSTLSEDEEEVQPPMTRFRPSRKMSPSPINGRMNSKLYMSKRPPSPGHYASSSDSYENSRPVHKSQNTTIKDLLDTRPPPSRERRPNFSSPTSKVSTASSSKRSVSQSPLIYAVADDELMEDENLLISGETFLHDSEDEDVDKEDDVPVRLLQDFVVYDMATNEAVPLSQLMYLPYVEQVYGASGIVKPWIEFDDRDDEEEDEIEFELIDDVEMVPTGAADAGQQVKLSKIIEFNIHHVSEKTKRLDSKIYIRTKFAWYILDTPAMLYTGLFTPFWLRHRILHLIVEAALISPRMTYEAFIESLKVTPEVDESAVLARKFLGRELRKEDVESDDVNSYLVATLQELCETRIGITRVPLIRSILGSGDYDEGNAVRNQTPSPRRKSRTPKSSKSSNINMEKEVLKHRNETVVTPIVARIAKTLFERSLEVAGQSRLDEIDDDVAVQIDDVRAHHLDPKNMRWGEKVYGGDFYDSVIMDGVTYLVGDVVMVNPGHDDNGARAKNAHSEGAQSVNSFGNRLWFCRICYFFEDVDKHGASVKMFHGQWFAHGSKTMLQETAHSKSLFLMNKCDDNPTASIFKKCNLKMLVPEDEELPDTGEPNSNDFHCGLIWSEEESDFLDLPRLGDVELVLASIPEQHKPCYSCGLKHREETRDELRRVSGGFSQYGVVYHVGDSVYIKPSANDGLLKIAQITKIKGIPDKPEITVRHFGRYDDFVRRQRKETNSLIDMVHDERCLISQTKTSTIYAYDNDGVQTVSKIVGICYVRYLTESEEIEDWTKHDDHFYVNQEEDGGYGETLLPMDPEDFKYCKACDKDRLKSLHHTEELMRRHEPLRGLELFSGAGGLGTGMDMSGFVETKYAVEFSPGAASTYRVNHPNTTVYCQDTNLLLKYAIDCHDGKEPKPLLSNDGKSWCKKMPDKDGVDFIYGGAPCQSFSLANHSKQADDIRSTLVCNMLSYVEFYEPSYFLLENVVGLLVHPLLSSQAEGRRGLEGGIKMGVVKFIERTLIALGYQVRHKVLQAGQYGAPQGRLRVIFWGAKRGVEMPNFPLPTHCYPRGVCRYNLPIGGKLQPVTRSKVPDDYHQCAPLRPVTVEDAIGDLPPFDWKNPHIIIPATAKDKAERKTRMNILHIPQFDAEVKKQSEQNSEAPFPGYPKSVAYAREPQNRYQRWIRKGMGDTVQGHYTRRFSAVIVERTVCVPLRPNADHKDLPDIMLPKKAKKGSTEEQKRSFYGRMDAEGYFRTAMTLVAPNTKNTSVLHPSQKRIVTVRECARAQGFPDYYKFMSVSKRPSNVILDQHRQIGNAVPVPLALALGKALGEALVKMWTDREREGSPSI